MGDPLTDERGVANRGTLHRIEGPPKGTTAESSDFSVNWLGLRGASEIRKALAFALKWQFEFLLTMRPLERKEIADKLIALWQFLKEMEEKSPRDPDGALLIDNWLDTNRRTKYKTRLHEMATGEAILISDVVEQDPLPVWSPAFFPTDMPLDERARYPARPQSVEQLPPFTDKNIRQWLLTSLLTPESASDVPPPPEPELPPGASGRVAEDWLITEPEETFNPDGDEAMKAVEDAARKVDRTRWNAARLAAFKGHTPRVNAAIAQLATITTRDLERHTKDKFRPEFLDDFLIQHTEVILYHSVCTFALDRNGEPFDLRYSSEGQGLVDYPILIEDPGETVRRTVPPDDGVYVSINRYGGVVYRLNDAGVTRLLFGKVGGFEAYGYGASDKSKVQKALESFMNNQGSNAYVAAITVPGAYDRKEITLSRIRNRIPEFVDVVTPYVVREIMKRAKYKLENWQKFAAEVVQSVIQELILDKVRDKIRDFLIKKIGKRIIPGVNAVAALHDLVAGGDERTRIRNIIACMMVALESDSTEDMHIAAKTCSKPVADEFEDAVMSALVKRSQKAAAKLKHKSKDKREADERAEKDQARDDARAAEAAQKKADAPADTASPPKVDASGKPVDVLMSNKKAADSTKDPKGNTAPPADKGKTPRPPNKEERKKQEAWAEKQREHEEKIRKKKEELKKEEEEKKKAAANGDPAGTADDGKKDKGTSKKSQGTGDKKTAKPPTRASDGWTPPKRPPRDPNEAPGTLEKPRPVPKGPEPDPEPMKVKDPDKPEGTDDVRDRPNVRTGRATHEQILRRNAENDGGAFPLDHDAHHLGPKKGGKEDGEAVRDSMSQSGVHVDESANASPARGMPRDPRAPLESSSQHWGLHDKKRLEQLKQELETVKGDPEATRDILKKWGLDDYEGRHHEPNPMRLGGDPDPPPPKEKPEPKDPPDPKDPPKPKSPTPKTPKKRK